MRTLVLEQFNKMVVSERPTPDPGPDEILIRVHATGICGSDVHGYTGENGRRTPGQVMGHETAGRISALGADVDPDRFAIGAPVTINPVVVPKEQLAAFQGREQHCPDKYVLGVAPEHQAAFADYVVVPQRNVVLLADGMPLEHGALIEPFAVAVHAVRRTSIAPGQRAVVIGGGPIGQSIVIALRMHGVTDICLVEPDEGRRALGESLGATSFDSRTFTADTLESDGGRADVAFDAVGITPTLRSALHSTKLGGEVCLVGMGAKEMALDAFRVSTEERSVIGAFTYSAQDFRDAAAYANEAVESFARMVSLAVGPEEADRAFSDLASGVAVPGKILVSFA